MADLTAIEKAKLEKLLGMSGGYVLDFSNRRLEEFVLQSVRRNIYDDAYNYSSGSKANRIRAFWDREPDSVVGKLIADLLEYSEFSHPSRDEESKRLHEDCRRIAERLLSNRANRAGVQAAAASMDGEPERPSALAQHLAALGQLKIDLEALFVQPDRQEAGLKLEKLLNRLFALFTLAPRRPFELVGEQIDGSFELDHEIYLLEAKWERKPLREKELLVFRGKIESVFRPKSRLNSIGHESSPISERRQRRTVEAHPKSRSQAHTESRRDTLRPAGDRQRYPVCRTDGCPMAVPAP